MASSSNSVSTQVDAIRPVSTRPLQQPPAARPLRNSQCTPGVSPTACSATSTINTPNARVVHDFSNLRVVSSSRATESPSTATPTGLPSSSSMRGFPSCHAGSSGTDAVRQAKNAYNMASFVTKRLNLHWLVFSTSMMYFHLVTKEIGPDGVRQVHEITLICACMLLAAKVEHCRVRLAKLIAVTFDVDPTKDAEDYALYRRMVLEAEMLVCSHLDFNFQRSTPFPRLDEVVPRMPHADGEHAGAAALASSTVASGSAEGTAACKTEEQLNHELHIHSNKLASYIFLSPICVTLRPEEIADALVYVVADAVGVLDRVRATLIHATPEVVAQVEGVILSMLASGGKQSKLLRLNEKVAEYKRKRVRSE